MATNNTTFWELINSHKIIIPIIQRDYAQGREEETEKRERFLNVILKHLNGDRKLHLDFVYGRMKDTVFYPIDGQQRLTTLFLLHWYFSLKEKINIEHKSKLTQFVYDTRISSREFCQSLIIEEIKIPETIGDGTFIKLIKNKFWYRNKWDTDPTVKAMLIMIQSIHDKFYKIEPSSVFKQLTEDKLISFELLDLGAKGFELTDELYIKMNARGKQLTSFENFKANFIQFIDRKFKDRKMDHPIKGQISYSGYFSYKIEKEWTDLFWAFRAGRKTTDEGFSNYFEFITQMLFFKKYKDSKTEDFKNSFLQYEDVYTNELNLLFLFNSLDKLYEILNINGKLDEKNINIVFNSITDESRLFWNPLNNRINFFERFVLNAGNEDARNKIMLFAILDFMIKHNLSANNQSLKVYVRVIRNLLQATRQRNDTKYNTNIRINNFGSYWLLFEQLSIINLWKNIEIQQLSNKGSQISDASLKNEIEKLKILQLDDHDVSSAMLALEEIEEFGGLIHQLKPNEHHSKYKDYLIAIKAIWDHSISDSLRIQALIACGFDSLKIKGTKMGDTYYFGKKGNWDVILTSEEDGISKSILALLDAYNNSGAIGAKNKLEAIRDNWLNNNKDDRSYKYYFLKYWEFTSKLNYYVWPSLYKIRILGTEGSNPLVAFHISPYVLTVCRKINNNDICDANQSYLQYSGNSPLILKNGITMESIDEGWKISLNSNNTDLISKYLVSFNDSFFLLKENETMDRIEIALDFIKYIYKQD